MPPTNIPANTQQNWKPLPPLTLDPGLGLGAFIVLEYTSTVGARLEHCVLFLAKEWDSMYELIRAPGVFMEALRNAYKATPKHDHGTMGNLMWEFNTPITIVIEPLTAPTAANKVLLMGLTELYPSLMNALDDSLTADEFATAVTTGASTPPAGFSWSSKIPPMAQTDVDMIVPTGSGGYQPKKIGHVMMNNETNWAKNAPKVSSTGTFTTGSTGTPPPPPVGTNFFPLQYVAEFALQTRTLYIRYIPHATTSAGTFGDTAGDEITAITVDPVQGTHLAFLHQDIVFSKSDLTPGTLADRRARFAMNFITDLRFLNKPSLLKVKPAAYLSTSPLLYAMNTVTLPTPTHKPILRPKVRPLAVKSAKPTPASAPTVIIDSVWPDPDQVKFSTGDLAAMFPPGNPTPEPDPPSPLCTVLVTTPVQQPNGTIVYVTAELIIKSYEPEQEP